MTPTEEIFTVAECIEGCDPDIRVKIIGKSKDRDTDCMSETYFDGVVGDIPEQLKKAEVLRTGYSYGSQCSCIMIPFGDYSESKNEESESPILQLITKGEFLDCVKSADGEIKYRCTAIVIRLTPQALNEWILPEPSNSKDFFETAEEYEKYLADKEKARDDLCMNIVKALDIDYKGVKITQNETEIFTVTQILPME